MSTVSKSIVLPNGQTMPTAVFGVYQIQDPAVCRKAVEDALEAGYRAIDTAVAYGNEAAVGAAIKASGPPRDEIFVTSKLWIQDASEKGAAVSVERSLELMGLDTLDLYLLHQPVGDVYGAWRTLERLHEEGVLAAIGVSNFAADRLMDFALHQKIRPMVNQIEINPFCQQAEALPVMRELGVVAQARAPFAEGRNGLFENPTLVSVARKHGRTVGQIVLRCVLELGAVVLAKTVRPERMRENLALYDFSLDEEDKAAISALDTGRSQFFSHRDPAMIKWLAGRRVEH